MYPYRPEENTGPDPNAPTVPSAYPGGPAWPAEYPMGMYQTPLPPTAPRRNVFPWAPFLGGVVVALILVAAILGIIDYGGHTAPTKITSKTPVATGGVSSTPASNPTATTVASATNPTATPTTSGVTALIPTGSLIYSTAAPGQCDGQGATWGTNGYVEQTCSGGALQASGANCNCALGVVVLQSLPVGPVPPQYALQFTVQSIGPGDTDRFGVKFYQEDTGASPPDSGNSRGGYSFLIDRTGGWQFNRYSDDGTRNTLDSGRYAPGMRGQHTVDISVGASSFGLFIDGSSVATEYDTTYTGGLLDLAVEPGAVVVYRNFALYNQPGQ